MSDPFEGYGVKQEIPRKALLIIIQTSFALKAEPEIVIFPGGVPEETGPWVCFNVGGRRFGIWTATMHLYEADEHGAMGTDILNPASLSKT